MYGGRFPSSLFDKSLKNNGNKSYKSIIMKLLAAFEEQLPIKYCLPLQ